MDRRRFLSSSVIAASGLVTGCRTGGPLTTSTADTEAFPPFLLEEYTIDELQASMTLGELTSASLTRLYLDRIEQLNTNGPALRAVIETNPQAVEIAQALDSERRTRGPRGPLHGIPIILKDNIDTADRMTTTAGSFALEGSIPPQDSFVAARLRTAGALVLGKANLSEWANFRSRTSSSGWSARGGQCRNPYVLDHNPCGSSSGSAVAVAANLAPAALGTETNGSILCPASRTGLVGIKPTVGLLSRSGVIPIAVSQDTVGPLARTVRDAAHLLGALIGVDPRDPVTGTSQGRSHADYTHFLDTGGLRGARLGVARNFRLDPAVWRLFETAISAMREGGAEVVDPANVPNVDRYGQSAYTVMLHEFKAGLNSYLESLGGGPPCRQPRRGDRIQRSEPRS